MLNKGGPMEMSFPLYTRALQQGILNGKSALIVAPTASGKSYIGKEIIINNLREKVDGSFVHAYLVPYRALASEIYDDFMDRLKDDETRIRLVTGDHRDPVNPESSDFIVATYESFDGLLRSGKINPGIIVADEVHLINDSHRGPVVEGLFARLKNNYPSSNLIALSAVIENPESIADWLQIDLLKGNAGDRPVPLAISYEFTNDKYEALYETLKPTLNDSQALIFCNSRVGAEKTARELADFFFADSETSTSAQYELSERINAIDSGLDELGKLVLKGVAYHHAGLTKHIRRLVEQAYRNGVIKIITSTPTLAAGVNLPAEIAVVRDIYRAESIRGRTRQVLISSGEILNMLGRAGRPNHSHLQEGQGIALIPVEDKGNEHVESLLKAIVEQHGGKVHSHLANSFEAIMRFVLSVVVDLGEATRDDVAEAYSATYAHFEDQEEIRYDRPFEIDIMEDIPSYKRVKDSRGKIFLKKYELSPDGVVATIASEKPSKTDYYTVEIGVTGVKCDCHAARYRKEVCKHAACAIHDLLFADNIEEEAQVRALYNCGHIFAKTLDPGTKLNNSLRILTIWGLLEKIPNGWRTSPVGELAVNTTFDLLLVRQIIERIKEGRDTDYKTVAKWAVKDYFAEENKRERWLKAIEKWLNEVIKIDYPTKYRGDFEHGLEDLAQVCALYEKAARVLNMDDLADSADKARRTIRFGVKPELVPLMALDFPQLRRGRSRMLFNAGIRKVDDLAKSNPDYLSKACGAPHDAIADWICRARDIYEARSVMYDEKAESEPEIDDFIARFKIDPDAFSEE